MRKRLGLCLQLVTGTRAALLSTCAVSLHAQQQQEQQHSQDGCVLHVGALSASCEPRCTHSAVRRSPPRYPRLCIRHFGAPACSHACLACREQEIRNIMWIAECVAQVSACACLPCLHDNPAASRNACTSAPRYSRRSWPECHPAQAAANATSCGATPSLPFRTRRTGCRMASCSPSDAAGPSHPCRFLCWHQLAVQHARALRFVPSTLFPNPYLLSCFHACFSLVAQTPPS